MKAPLAPFRRQYRLSWRMVATLGTLETGGILTALLLLASWQLELIGPVVCTCLVTCYGLLRCIRARVQLSAVVRRRTDRAGFDGNRHTRPASDDRSRSNTRASDHRGEHNLYAGRVPGHHGMAMGTSSARGSILQDHQVAILLVRRRTTCTVQDVAPWLNVLHCAPSRQQKSPVNPVIFG